MIALAFAMAATQAGWHTYVNVLHRYAVCYPASMMPAPEAPNGDGRAFEAHDGGRMLAFGRYDDGVQASAAAERDARELSRPGGRITYRAQGSGWAVRSGITGMGRTFYERVEGAGGDLAILEITYPTRLAEAYGPIVSRASSCMRRTD